MTVQDLIETLQDVPNKTKQMKFPIYLATHKEAILYDVTGIAEGDKNITFIWGSDSPRSSAFVGRIPLLAKEETTNEP